MLSQVRRIDGWGGGGGGRSEGREGQQRCHIEVSKRRGGRFAHPVATAQPDTYGADFPHFVGSAVVVVDLLDVPLIAGGLDRPYAHLLLVVVVVALLLANKRLVAVT